MSKNNILSACEKIKYVSETYIAVTFEILNINNSVLKELFQSYKTLHNLIMFAKKRKAIFEKYLCFKKKISAIIALKFI